MSSPKIAITTYIASSPDQVWRALTDPDITERYWGNTRIESDWKVGSKIIYRRNGEITDEHTVIASEPPRHLVHTFHPVFGEFQSEPPSRVTMDITPTGEAVKLVVIHEEFPEISAVHRACSEGWPMILSSLKTLLETGNPLVL